MRVRRTSIALTMAAALVLAACNGAEPEVTEETQEPDEATDDAEEADEAPEDAVSLSFATIVEPAHPFHRCGAEPFAEQIAERSGGSLEIELFASEQLGTEAESLDSVVAGDIDMALINPGHTANYLDRLSVLGAAYLFADIDGMLEVSRGEVGQELWAELEAETGLVTLDTWPLGVRQVTTNDVAATSPDDLAGVSMRAPDAPIWIANVEVLGASPTPMALGEIYTSLQQGVIQAQENPVDMIETQSFDEVQEYLIMTDHVVQGNQVFVNGDVWDGLSGEQQDLLIGVAQEMGDEVQACVEGEFDEIVDAWRESGELEIIEDVDRDAFRERAEDLLLEQFGDDWDGLYEQIREAQGL